MARLEVLAEPAAGVPRSGPPCHPPGLEPGDAVELGPGVTVFGRATWLAEHHPDAVAVLLPGFAVAKEHARVTRRADGYVLEDLNSRNGTYRNGRRLDAPALLRDGDEVYFPGFAFAFRDDPAG